MKSNNEHANKNCLKNQWLLSSYSLCLYLTDRSIMSYEQNYL